MAITGINHVALQVRDLEESRKFFELLGFEESGHRDGMLFFAVGGHHHHIALIDSGADAPRVSRAGACINHFAVTVDEESEMGRLSSVMRDAGYKIRRSIDHSANLSVYVEDPNGIIVEITYDVPKEKWAHIADNPFGQDKPYNPLPEDA
ncbi:MAG: VOC family protein [SAR324 cluster bacterium]|nr:VOC family protein [SAR324 cluster bacterium]